MRRLIIGAIALAIAGSVLPLQARGPAWITQYVCDRNPEGGFCLQYAAVKTRADETRGRFTRPGTVRAMRAAVMSQDALMPFRREWPMEPRNDPTGGGGCKIGDVGCGCYTPFWVTPTLLACDGACTSCYEKNAASFRQSLGLQ